MADEISQEFWENRIAATDPPILPRETRIPEKPDQSEFLHRWFEYHRGHSPAEMPWKEVAPGHLPLTGPAKRFVTSQGARQEARRTDHVSLESTLDSLLEAASNEREMQRPSRQHASSPRSRESRTTSLRGHIPTLGQIQAAQERINAAAERRQLLSESLAAADAELRGCRERHAQLSRECRTAQNFERVFGTRDEVRELGSNYVSPLLSMFSRAYDRYAIAEEVRAEERASNQNSERNREHARDLDRRGYGSDVVAGDQREVSTLQHRLLSLDDERLERPPPLEEEEMVVKLGCKICLQQRADTAVLPCGHLVMCNYCAAVAVPTKSQNPTQPLRRNTLCPLCRKPVKRVARLFTA